MTKHAGFRLAALSLAVVACGGCFSAQLYEGAKRDRDEVARISGDPVVTAGSPITVVLRRVDEHDLGIAQSSVEVLEGEHSLLVDCRIAEDVGIAQIADRHRRLPPRRSTQ